MDGKSVILLLASFLLELLMSAFPALPILVVLWVYVFVEFERFWLLVLQSLEG